MTKDSLIEKECAKGVSGTFTNVVGGIESRHRKFYGYALVLNSCWSVLKDRILLIGI